MRWMQCCARQLPGHEWRVATDSGGGNGRITEGRLAESQRRLVCRRWVTYEAKCYLCRHAGAVRSLLVLQHAIKLVFEAYA